MWIAAKQGSVMSINGISNSTSAIGTPVAQSNVEKTLEQRAQEGDQTAVAEIKQEQQQEQPSTSAGSIISPLSP
jgi:hypothetical protein